MIKKKKKKNQEKYIKGSYFLPRAPLATWGSPSSQSSLTLHFRTFYYTIIDMILFSLIKQKVKLQFIELTRSLILLTIWSTSTPGLLLGLETTSIILSTSPLNTTCLVSLTKWDCSKCLNLGFATVSHIVPWNSS